MSELDPNSEVESNTEELDTLKKRATTMGIDFHPKIGLTKLKAKVQDKLDSVRAEDSSTKAPQTLKDTGALTEEQYKKIKAVNTRKACGALKVIQVTCMNPDKKNWPGEVFSAGSAKLGTWKKFVPFGSEVGYHVPQILIDMMKERKFSQFRKEKGPKGVEITKGYLVPEFAINILPDLTQEQMQDLANQQAASGSIR